LASISRNVWSVRKPGIRQRTSRLSVRASDRLTEPAAAHSRSASADERR
jgi:hypothetical protein